MGDLLLLSTSDWEPGSQENKTCRLLKGKKTEHEFKFTDENVKQIIGQNVPFPSSSHP